MNVWKILTRAGTCFSRSRILKAWRSGKLFCGQPTEFIVKTRGYHDVSWRFCHAWQANNRSKMCIGRFVFGRIHDAKNPLLFERYGIEVQIVYLHEDGIKSWVVISRGGDRKQTVHVSRKLCSARRKFEQRSVGSRFDVWKKIKIKNTASEQCGSKQTVFQWYYFRCISRARWKVLFQIKEFPYILRSLACRNPHIRTNDIHQGCKKSQLMQFNAQHFRWHLCRTDRQFLRKHSPKIDRGKKLQCTVGFSKQYVGWSINEAALYKIIFQLLLPVMKSGLFFG